MDHNPTIIKLGSTLPWLAVRHGDFEDWIISGMGLAREDVPVIDPTQQETLPTPEFDAEIVRTYINTFRATLYEEGQDPESLMAGCEDVPYGPTILQRFAEMVHARVRTIEPVADGAATWR